MLKDEVFRPISGIFRLIYACFPGKIPLLFPEKPGCFEEKVRHFWKNVGHFQEKTPALGLFEPEITPISGKILLFNTFCDYKYHSILEA